MDIGTRIKKYRESEKLSQEDLALKIYVSRQTVSNWETNKSYPDIKSLALLSNIFNVSLDDFIKEDVEEMRKIIDKEKVKKFNMMSYIFLFEIITVIVSAVPLFKFYGKIGIVIWFSIYVITFITAAVIEKIKKNNNIQTYKEILAFVENKNLTYAETQQELGKRLYQKIFFAIAAAFITLVVNLIIMVIIKYI